MPEQVNKTPCCVGLLAHVDAGKTTLSEAMLYESGARRVLGRVDHQDAFLDTDALERARGITIFSKQALLETAHRQITLVDTPGHVDFAPEAERTLPIVDCAVLVISGTDGVQAHTLTLWRLLERYSVPTFLFINKMDLPGGEKQKLLLQLQAQLSPGCVDFGEDFERIAENAALCDEALLETYLETGVVTQGNLRGLIEKRKLFPCCFGSALKLEGVDRLLDILDVYAPEKQYPAEFGAKVYKISRDPQGNRLTWLRITGGTLKVRTTLSYRNRKGEPVEEKILQLRQYSSDKFTAPETLEAGTLAAVTGLTQTWAGQSLGGEPAGKAYSLEPVMTYRVKLPAGSDPAVVLPKLRLLEEEEPQLRLLWENGEIHVQIMGKVQLEIFRALVKQRFNLDVELDDPRIFYKETIETTVEGVGHFEPLRHYAEVHLLLEPWYDFVLTVPTEQIGRGITDIRAMGGEFEAPEAAGTLSTLRGLVPAAEVRDYAETLAAYTQGLGRLQLSLHGYAPCHNAEAVIAQTGYDPEADLENTPDSVFCAHGAGFNVKWDQVKDYMHLESGLQEEKAPRLITRNLHLEDKELEAIMEREFGAIRRPQYGVKTENRPATEDISIAPPRQKYLIVDGYNIIFAWDDLAELARSDLDAARRRLCDSLSSYAGFTKCRTVVVFDGYKQKGNPGEKQKFHNIQVVYTKEGETADAYIEALAYETGGSYAVRVATSDALVQLSSFHSGVLRMSARELRQEVETARKEMQMHFTNGN